MKKLMVFVAVVALATAGLILTAGCAPKKAEPLGKVSAAGGKTLKKLVLPLDRTSIGIINEVLAYELKYFEEGGLDVEFQALNTSGVNMSQLAAVSTGKIDLANSTGTTAPLLFIEQGNDIVILGGTMAEGAAAGKHHQLWEFYAGFALWQENRCNPGQHRGCGLAGLACPAGGRPFPH